MSRYGKTPISVPKGVEIKQDKGELKVKGPKGELKTPLIEGIDITNDGLIAHVILNGKASVTGAFHGLYRSLLNNMIIGVTKGFEKRLQMIGVGYRASLQGRFLDLQVGLSHPTKIEIPKEINVEIEKNTLIKITGINKQSVGQFAATIRSKKPPEPYKGKGIRYEDEYVRKKAGKAAKGKTA